MCLSRETKQKLIVYLQELGTGERQPQCRTKGLCFELNNYTEFFHSLLGYNFVTKYSRTWSKYSGDWDYPVPCGKFYIDGEYAYDFFRDKWDDNTYGDNRRELCLHIASELQKELLQVNL